MSVNERMEKIGGKITVRVGTMWTALVFACLALVSLPAVIRSGDPVLIVAWITQTFLQLVLLPVIMVGQAVQGRKTEKTIMDTYELAKQERASHIKELAALQTLVKDHAKQTTRMEATVNQVHTKVHQEPAPKKRAAKKA